LNGPKGVIDCGAADAILLSNVRDSDIRVSEHCSYLLDLLVIKLGSASNAEKLNRSEPNYVGGGRYTCYEKTVGCAVIKQNNRRITQEEIERRDRNRYSPSSERRESPWKPDKVSTPVEI